MYTVLFCGIAYHLVEIENLYIQYLRFLESLYMVMVLPAKCQTLHKLIYCNVMLCIVAEGVQLPRQLHIVSVT